MSKRYCSLKLIQEQTVMSYRANSFGKKDGIQKIAEPMEWCYLIVLAVKKKWKH